MCGKDRKILRFLVNCSTIEDIERCGPVNLVENRTDTEGRKIQKMTAMSSSPFRSPLNFLSVNLPLAIESLCLKFVVL